MVVAFPQDLEATEKLRKALEPFGVFETQEEKDHRALVISMMNEMVRTWIAVRFLPVLQAFSFLSVMLRLLLLVFKASLNMS